MITDPEVDELDDEDTLDDLDDTPTTPAGPYARAAMRYLHAGWAPLPLPPAHKFPPPLGWTGGKAERYPSGPDVQAWIDGDVDWRDQGVTRTFRGGDGNIAVRPAADVIGLDVDCYDGKPGAATIAAHEQQFGPLPPTWTSTSRTDGSGIRWFRVPERLRWRDLAGGGVEIVRAGHRYGVVWPSVHDKTGNTYRWVPPGADPTVVLDDDVVPSVHALTKLPDTWVYGLTGGELAVDAPRAGLNHDAGRAWITTPTGTAAACWRVTLATNKALADLGLGASRHDVAARHVQELAHLHNEGHRGVTAALATVRDAFAQAVGSDRDTTEEWARMCAGAIDRAAGNVTDHADACHCDNPLQALAGLIPADHYRKDTTPWTPSSPATNPARPTSPSPASGAPASAPTTPSWSATTTGTSSEASRPISSAPSLPSTSPGTTSAPSLSASSPTPSSSPTRTERSSNVSATASGPAAPAAAETSNPAPAAAAPSAPPAAHTDAATPSSPSPSPSPSLTPTASPQDTSSQALAPAPPGSTPADGSTWTAPTAGSSSATQAPPSPSPSTEASTPPSAATRDAASNAPAADTAAATDDEAAQLDAIVQYHTLEAYVREKARRLARERADNEDAAASWRAPVWIHDLAAELQEPDEPVTYRIDGLLPTRGNVILTAQFKAGKTTCMNALLWSLADGHRFLGHFNTVMPQRRIACWNYEVDAAQWRRWVRDVGIDSADRITHLPLRGYRMPLRDPRIEAWAVEWLKRHDVEVWVIDPLARAMVGSVDNENDNTQVGAFLDTIDVIKEKAGVSEVIIPVHTGRGGEGRARGATRVDDWPDVAWTLVKNDEGERFFRAYGRDVDVAEGRLSYDYETRGLRYVEGEDRKSKGNGEVVAAVLACIEDAPGVSLRGLRQAVRLRCKAGSDSVDEAVRILVQQSRVQVVKGPRDASLHYPWEASNTGGRP